MKVLLVLILSLSLLTPMTGTAYLYEKFFGSRLDDTLVRVDPLMADCPNLYREPISFNSNKGQILNGYVYKGFAPPEEPLALIVLSHGIGGGHESYLRHIDYFVGEGFWVLAFDNTGTLASGGTGLLGLPQACLDLKAALCYVQGEVELNSYPCLLYGHSMGGYAVCSVLNYDLEVDGLISLSGFNKSSDIIMYQTINAIGSWAKIFAPFLRKYEEIKFGPTANFTAAEGLKKAQIPALIVHGALDDVISLKASVYRHFADKELPYVSVSLEANKGHSITLSENALNYIKENNMDSLEFKGSFFLGQDKVDDEFKSFMASLDRFIINEPDLELMASLASFFKELVEADNSLVLSGY